MRHNFKKTAQISLIVGVFLLIGTFAFFKTRDLLFGTTITIASPANGETVSQEVITVRGQAKNLASISMNGRPLIVDPNGNFEEKISLAPGYTKILLEGVDRFHREVEKTLEIVYQPPADNPVTSLNTLTPHN